MTDILESTGFSHTGFSHTGFSHTGFSRSICVMIFLKSMFEYEVQNWYLKFLSVTV